MSSATPFPYRDTAMKHSLCPASNFSVSFGPPPNGCILCQLNSLFRHRGNCLAGNGRRDTLLSRGPASREIVLIGSVERQEISRPRRDTPFAGNSWRDNDHRISPATSRRNIIILENYLETSRDREHGGPRIIYDSVGVGGTK